MKQIRVNIKSNNDVWFKSVNVVMTDDEVKILKHCVDPDEYEVVWDYLVSKLERMSFPDDDWFIDTIKYL